MNSVKIMLPHKRYLPGDTIEGKVVLNCDEYFKCKSASFDIQGNLTYYYSGYRVTGAAKGHFEMQRYVRSLYDARSVFAENMDFDPGTYEFPFQFQLPDDLKPSYRISNFDIGYFIGVVMEISRKKRIHDASIINILKQIEELPDVVIEASNPDFTEKSIKIRMDSQRYCIGEDITFSYLVDTDVRFDYLRAEIEHLHHFEVDKREKIPKNKRTIILLKEKTPSEDITRHEWTKWVLRFDEQLPVTFSFDDLHSRLALKVTIERRLNFDITARIPLITGHCLKPGWREEPETGKVQVPETVAPTDERISNEERERSAQFWYNRAITFRDKGEIAKAIRSADTAIKWHPDSAEALALRDELKKREE